MESMEIFWKAWKILWKAWKFCGKHGNFLESMEIFVEGMEILWKERKFFVVFLLQKNLHIKPHRLVVSTYLMKLGVFNKTQITR